MSNINKEYKHVFIHIPKNAGTSMEHERFVKGSGHTNLYHLLRDPRYDPSYFIWAFVRNPYVRVSSAFYMNKNKFKEKILRDFVYNIEKYIDPDFFNFTKEHNPDPNILCHFYPQCYYIQNTDPTDIFLGRVENIDEDWKKILIKINENIESPPLNINIPLSRKRGQGNKTEKLYLNEYTQKAKDIIYNLYKKDFEYLDYKQ